MRLSRFAAALALSAFVVACDDDDPIRPDTTLNIAVVSGAAQAGLTVGQPAPQQLSAKVTNTSGIGVEGVQVNWTVASGGGTVSPATSTTNAQGIASTTLTLGAAPGNHNVTATVADQPSASVGFSNSAVLNIAVESGLGQAAVVNTALGTPFTAKVTNGAGQPVAGVTVQWATTAGAGAVTPTSSVTNAAGLATATLTVGPAQATNEVVARLALAPTVSASFTAAGKWEEFIATMNSAGEPTNTNVPAVGTARYQLVNGTTITYQVDVPSGLTGTWTGLHIHAPKPAASPTVGVAVNLCPATVTCAIGTGGSFSVAGSFTGANVPVGFGATEQARLDSLVKLMRLGDGSAYTNLHTSVNTGGQIRGPILISPPTPAPARRED